MNVIHNRMKLYERGAITETDLNIFLVQEAGRLGAVKVISELPDEIVKTLEALPAVRDPHKQLHILVNATFVGPNAAQSWHELQNTENTAFMKGAWELHHHFFD